MAEMEKFTDDAVKMLLKHAKRELKNDHNKDIIEDRSSLNYSVGLSDDYSPLKEYKKIIDGSYLYGRGTKREKEAITCCSWVITLPKSVSDYTAVGKDEIKRLNPDEERQFFDGVCQFVSARYGSVFYNRVHYDEGGQPHVHIYFVPRTKLDHDLVQNKTSKSNHFIKTESGRYEYQSKLQLDKNGEKIPVKNYSRDTDHFDTKISAFDVMNRAELQHFHGDLSAYLSMHQIPGSESIYTGKTGSSNLTVKTMKEFKERSGLTIEELREKPLSQEALQEVLEGSKISKSQKLMIENINAECLIRDLEKQLLQERQKTQERRSSWERSTGWGHKEREETRSW